MMIKQNISSLFALILCAFAITACAKGGTTQVTSANNASEFLGEEVASKLKPGTGVYKNALTYRSEISFKGYDRLIIDPVVSYKDANNPLGLSTQDRQYILNKMFAFFTCCYYVVR